MASNNRSRLVLTTLAVVLLTGSACAGQPSDDAAPKVATLASTAPTAPASAKPERPRERLDTTAEEQAVMLRPYNDCFQERTGIDPNNMGKTKPPAATMEKVIDAKQSCSTLLPLPPWEKDPANPEAKDFARDVLKCLRAKGVTDARTGDNGIDIDFAGGYEQREAIRKSMDKVPDCEREVAASR